MPLEKGGRADKMGNRYEVKCIIYELLKILREVNYSVVIEALGEDEVGTDILVTNIRGEKEHQQCKVRNASSEIWTIADLDARNILTKWKQQLERDKKRGVALVSPIGCSYIVDLHNRAINTSGNPMDFYECQIKKSSTKLKNAYEAFCVGMGLKIGEVYDIAKSIDFLRRINFYQMSEYALQESIGQEINYYFITDRERVYNAFVTLVVDSDIYGKEITALALRTYLQEQKISMRIIEADQRIYPKIECINREYRDSFRPLKEGLLERTEIKQCIDAIKRQESFIISGDAGCGKSGCTEAILNYCENRNIPHIALKLDRRIPHGNAEIWGKDFGFTCSIVHVLDAISKNQVSVLIMDQLDALRWTQTNSYEALTVCMEMIKQVSHLNEDRAKKIVIVFVCREYDLRNDNNIKFLFENERKETQNIKWAKILISDFEESTVKEVVGNKYEQLTSKARNLLRRPSNLYIWQHLDEDVSSDDCTTTSHLIDAWFSQICRKSSNVGVDETLIKNTVVHVVKYLDQKGRLYAPKKVLDIEEKGLDYLVSVGLMVVDGQRVGFVHQSILDYFISSRMIKQFYDGETIEQIVGEKNKQTPGKRYQVQMFLQNLLEYDSSDFISAGMQLEKSTQIRYYVKYIFYEILRQISEPDEEIIEYIIKTCADKESADYLLKNVVWRKNVYIYILTSRGVLEQWLMDDEKKQWVYVLLESIYPEWNSPCIELIRKYSFVNEADDKNFMNCFLHNVMQESEEVFELRMQFYNKYPLWAQDLYIDVKSMMQHCEARTIRLIAFWLNNKVKSHGESIYRYEEELIDETNPYLVNDGVFVLEQLIPAIPKSEEMVLYLSEWSGSYLHRNSIERAAVELIKKANIAIISKNPEYFWKYYAPYRGKNYAVYNEIILHGMCFLPQSYSNQIIEYLTGDFDKKVFDYTSGAENELGLFEQVLKVHTAYCGDEHLYAFLEAVVKYIPPESKENYKRRIEFNRKKENPHVYWSFWGDFQYHILQSVPSERLTPKYKELLNVLDRKFRGQAYRYINRNGHYGWVKSPISEKKLGEKQWKQIITNKKILEREHSNWKEVDGGFIESSLSTYVSDFTDAVRSNPSEMIEMMIEVKEKVIPAYIDAMYLGVESSGELGQIKQFLLEKMFKEFPCDMKSQRALYLCGIIEKAKIYSWSPEVIDILKEIVLHYEGNGESYRCENNLNCEDLISKSLNCVKGYAIRAIGYLMWENKDIFDEFKDMVDRLTLDRDPAIRMASFEILWPAYNIDRDWTTYRILRVYESDVRMAGYSDSKKMFFLLYKKYRKRILAIIRKCFETNDKRLIELGGYSICEFYIRYNEFADVIFDVEKMNEDQARAILQMAVLYLKFDEYRELSKKLILEYKNSNMDFEFPISKMFYDRLVDVDRDAEFLLEIMRSNISKRVVYVFAHFVEKNACSVKKYAQVIIALSENILNIPKEQIDTHWIPVGEISKLIIGLYDETSNTNRESDRKIAEKCLDLWDVMFERQIGEVRDLSRELMER